MNDGIKKMPFTVVLFAAGEIAVSRMLTVAQRAWFNT